MANKRHDMHPLAQDPFLSLLNPPISVLFRGPIMRKISCDMSSASGGTSAISRTSLPSLSNSLALGKHRRPACVFFEICTSFAAYLSHFEPCQIEPSGVEAKAGAALTPPGFPAKICSAFGQEGFGIGKIGAHVRNSKILFENCWGNCCPQGLPKLSDLRKCPFTSSGLRGGQQESTE